MGLPYTARGYLMAVVNGVQDPLGASGSRRNVKVRNAALLRRRTCRDSGVSVLDGEVPEIEFFGREPDPPARPRILRVQLLG